VFCANKQLVKWIIKLFCGWHYIYSPSRLAKSFCNLRCASPGLDMDRVHPWIGSGRVGLLF